VPAKSRGRRPTAGAVASGARINSGEPGNALWRRVAPSTCHRGAKTVAVVRGSSLRRDQAQRGAHDEARAARYRRPSMPVRWRAAPASSPARPARRSAARFPKAHLSGGATPTSRNNPATKLRAQADKPGEPGEALHREPLNAGDVLLDVPRRGPAGNAAHPSRISPAYGARMRPAKVSATTDPADTRSTTGCSPIGSAGKSPRIVPSHDNNDFLNCRIPPPHGFRIIW
jgi:hypothetical protein